LVDDEDKSFITLKPGWHILLACCGGAPHSTCRSWATFRGPPSCLCASNIKEEAPVTRKRIVFLTLPLL